MSFSEYTKGKVVLLNFWGTWCGPCKMELPDLIQISKDLAGKDFVMIGIASENVAPDQAMLKVEKFATSAGIPYLNFLINNKIRESYGGINSIPNTFIINKKGEVVETIVGMKNKDYFMKAINKVLE